MEQPVLETDNRIIKLLDFSQAQLICDYYLRNKTNFIPWEPSRNDEFYTVQYWRKQILMSVDLFEKKQAVMLVALDPLQSQVIATCNFSNIVLGCFEACHLGYSIDKDHEGKGIMYEIIKAGVKYMKDEFKLHRIMANHLPENIRSERLLMRLGFAKEGYAQSYLKINGKWQDHVLNSLVLPSE